MDNANALDAQQSLLRQVSVPAFWAKVASDVGYTPADDAAADRVLRLGDLVVPTVALYLEKAAAARSQDASSLVKDAADTAFAAAGAIEPSVPSDYLTIPGVRESALSLLSAGAAAAS